VKAIIYESYGPPEVLKLADVEKPVPRDNEVLVKIHATTVTAADRRIRSFDVPSYAWLPGRLFFGLSGPRRKILGCEFAGEIETAGRDVTRFKPGDPVLGMTDAGFGAYAEFKAVRANRALARKPQYLSFAEAAAIPFGGITALVFFRKGKIRRDDTVLINGASGGVGTAAVQLAKHFGTEVTGVCSTANLDMVRSIGADHVIDYTKEDFTRNGETYDIIMDTVGTAPWSRCKGSLRDDGRLLLVYSRGGDLVRIPWLSLTGKQRIYAGAAPVRTEDLEFLVELAEAGEFKPVIDRTYSFDEMLDAHRYVDQGHKKGNVVVTVVP
jgi:NADPH:quinone reductase-like Zn-dependent oxidoreductase